MSINLISYQTIVRKQVMRLFTLWIQTLIPPVITMTLYFMIFGRFIGSQVRDISGHSYMEFIIPGIIMMAVIMNSYSNVAASFFGAKFQRNIEEILVSPTSDITLILGYVTGGVVRGLLVGSVVLILSFFFAQPAISNIFIVFAFFILASLVFALAGFLNAIFAKNWDDISVIPTFVLTPLTYLSGVFYSLDVLSPAWQLLSRLNPILYMVNGFRYGFLGISDIPAGIGLAML